jgi:hypothetical protein
VIKILGTLTDIIGQIVAYKENIENAQPHKEACLKVHKGISSNEHDDVTSMFNTPVPPHPSNRRLMA